MDKTKLSIFGISLLILSIFSLMFVSSSDYYGKIGIDVGDGDIIIDTGGCDEDWSCFWDECTNNEQTYFCFDKNYCGTIDLRPSNHGDTQTCGTVEEYCGDGVCNNDETCGTCSSDCGSCSTGGGGSSSGSGSSSGGSLTTTSSSTGCIEDWECGEWSLCMKGLSGRSCEDLNDCGTETLKPELTQECSMDDSEGGIGGLSGITGAVIGAIQLNPEVASGIGALVIIGLGTGLFIFIKKKGKK